MSLQRYFNRAYIGLSLQQCTMVSRSGGRCFIGWAGLGLTNDGALMYWSAVHPNLPDFMIAWDMAVSRVAGRLVVPDVPPVSLAEWTEATLARLV